MIIPNSSDIILGSMTLIGVGMAFAPQIRREIFKRDHGVCQCDACIGEYILGEPLKWDRGFNVNAAHFPDLHGKDNDTNMSNGRILSVVCHITEEIERNNHRGVALLYEKQTIMNTAYLKAHEWHDIKPPLNMFYDWVETKNPELIIDYFTSRLDYSFLNQQ